MASFRILNLLTEPSTALIHIGATHTTLWLTTAHRPVAVHRLPLGGHAITQALSVHRQVAYDRIETAKRQVSVLPDRWDVPATEGQLTRLDPLLPILRRWTAFIQDALTHAQRQASLSHTPPIFLTGGAAAWTGLDTLLHQVLDRPVTRWTPGPHLPASPPNALPAQTTWATFAPAYGAAWSARP